jgi:hypothetical protein
MAMVGSPLDAAVSAGSTIGRYFSIAVLIPATVLVTYLAALLGAGALLGPFRPSSLPAALSSWGLSGLGWLTAISIVTGLCLHPLTFTFTQLLEGYWGAGRLGLLLTEHHVRRHRQQVFRLHAMVRAAHEELSGPVSIPESASAEEKGALHKRAASRARARLSRPGGDHLLRPYLQEDAGLIALGAYPAEIVRLLPTRLGNALRRMEDLAGTQYGLDAITVTPYLAMVADPRHYGRVSAARETLDLMVNLCVAGAIGCLATLILLADNGLWAGVALAPFALSWAAYQGAVGAAQEFGATVSAMIDLSRFHLYDALRLEQPRSTVAEAKRGPLITALLSGKAVTLDLTPPNGETEQGDSPPPE